MVLRKRKPLDPVKWRQDLELLLARRLVPRVRRATSSSTLKRYLQAYVSGPASAKRGRRVVVIGVPHYWAVYYHDGTDGFGPTGGRRFLVWFPRNALDNDPRLGGQWPIRYSDWRRLTKEEFKLIVEINREVYGRFSSPEFAMITRGPIGPRAGTKFFEKGLTGSAQQVAPVINRKFSQLVRSYVISETSTIRVGGRS